MQTQTAYQPTNTTYQPYTFGPSTLNPPPSSRNTGIPETSIAGPVPSIPRAEPTSSLPEQEAQHTRTVPVKPKRPSLLRARKAAMKLTPSAVRQLQLLSTSSEAGRTIKVGVKQKGCSGLQYDLEYVDKPGMLDEVVEQDGVKVIIDSKALMSIIGSQMDWVEDRLNQKFVFSNPNISKLSVLSCPTPRCGFPPADWIKN